MDDWYLKLSWNQTLKWDFGADHPPGTWQYSDKWSTYSPWHFLNSLVVNWGGIPGKVSREGNALTGPIAQAFGRFEEVAIIRNMQLNGFCWVLLMDWKR